MRALIVGSAHLDVLARPFEESTHIDRRGDVRFEIGGAACNVAFAFIKLGVDARLLTAWSSSAFSQLIENKLKSVGVEVLGDFVPGMDQAAFVAQLSQQGDLASAVSSMPIENYDFGSSRIEQSLEEVDCVVVECNLKSSVIRDVAHAAHKQGIPTYVLGVSEDKVDRLLSASRYLSGAFMNRNECNRLMNILGVVDVSEMADAIGCFALVTQAERGSIAYFPSGGKERIQPCELVNINNTLGVGDAFSAGVIDGLVRHHLSIQEAAVHAHKILGDIASSNSCNSYSINALTDMVDGLSKEAENDRLTGLFARRAFERMYVRQQTGENVLLLIDCDNFKQVNDTYGHDVGDQVLIEVANIIENNIRSVDIACRWGGDEFVVLLTRTKMEHARVIAEHIREVIADRDFHGVTLSIGLATTKPDESLVDSMRCADDAMYVAKRGGRNAVVTSYN